MSERSAASASDGSADGRAIDDELPASALLAERAKALAVLYAHRAASDPAVVEFRRDILHGRLLAPATWHAWIEGHDRGPELLARLILTPAQQSEAVHHSPLPEPLASLWRAAVSLVRRFGWSTPDSVRYLLTATVPRVVPLSYTIDPAGEPTAWRVTLTIDPSTPPDEVARFYQQARKAEIYGTHAARPQPPRTLALAVFALTCWQPGESTTDEARRWNARHPDWRYDLDDPASVHTLRRDMEEARDQLLNPRSLHSDPYEL